MGFFDDSIAKARQMYADRLNAAAQSNPNQVAEGDPNAKFGFGGVYSGYVNKMVTSNPTADIWSKGYGSAADRFATITRAQWEDYKKRFNPIEDQLLAAYGNPAMRESAITAAQGLTNKAFDTAEATEARELSRYGVTRNADETAANIRTKGLSRTAALVNAANKTRQHIAERDIQLASGSIPSGGRQYGLYNEQE